MAGMKRTTRNFLKQLAINLVGLFVTMLVLDRFGWLGVLALFPISLGLLLSWFAIREKWERRDAIK